MLTPANLQGQRPWSVRERKLEITIDFSNENLNPACWLKYNQGAAHPFVMAFY